MEASVVSLIIPAINEGKTISKVIRDVRKHAPHSTQIIVVDGGSSDRTDEIAKKEGVEVVVELRPGYGRAIRSGLERGVGDIFVIIDADDTYEASDIPRLIKPLLEGKADVSLASRIAGSMLPGSMPKTNYLGNRILTWLYNKLYWQRLTDSQTGFRALTKEALKTMTLKEDDMAFSTEMITQAVRHGLRIVEVPTAYKPRNDCSKSKLNRFKAVWEVFHVLLFG